MHKVTLFSLHFFASFVVNQCNICTNLTECYDRSIKTKLRNQHNPVFSTKHLDKSRLIKLDSNTNQPRSSDGRNCTRHCWKLACVMPDGRCESTFSPLLVLVINDNTHIVGLILLSSMFQTSSTVAWQGHEDVDPFKIQRIKIGKASKLFIFC